MTAAEKLKAWGREEGLELGREEGRIETAIALLKAGSEVKFVAGITKLDISRVLELKAQLDSEL